VTCPARMPRPAALCSIAAHHHAHACTLPDDGHDLHACACRHWWHSGTLATVEGAERAREAARVRAAEAVLF
jgi:hypothetical protein